MKLKKSLGFAQIPLLIGLLLMAIAIPIVTRLVQQNQENRGHAASGCSSDAMCGHTSANCCYCMKNAQYPAGTCVCGCSGSPTIGAPTAGPTSKPNPTAGPTSKPNPSTAPTNTPCGSTVCCHDSDCKNKYVNCPQAYCAEVGGVYGCYGTSGCVVPTAVPTTPPPTAVPTATPTPKVTPTTALGCNANNCLAKSGCCCGQTNCQYGFSCANYQCISNPTATPTLAGDCGQLYNRHNGCSCSAGLQCASLSCPGGICGPSPTAIPTTCAYFGSSLRCTTPVPTSIPTATPTVIGNRCFCYTACNSGNYCWNGAYETGAVGCASSYCQTAPTSTPTKVPTATPTVLGNACYCYTSCTSGNYCWNGGYQTGAVRCNASYCQAVPPTSVPTSIPTVILPTGGLPTNPPSHFCPAGESYLNECFGWQDGSCGGFGCPATQMREKVQCCYTGQCVTAAQANVCAGGGRWTESGSCINASKCSSTITPSPTTAVLSPTESVSPTEPVSPTPGLCSVCPNDFQCMKNTSGTYKWFSSFYQEPGYELVTGTAAATCGGVPKPTYMGRSKGDADCDGLITINDASIWRSEFINGGMETVNSTAVSNTLESDFDCDGKATLNDFSIWRANFTKSLGLL